MYEWNYQLGVRYNSSIPHGYECLCPECKWDFSAASLENRGQAVVGFFPQFHRPWNDTVIVGKGVIQCPECQSRFWIYFTERLVNSIYTWKAGHLELHKFLVEQFAGRLTMKEDEKTLGTSQEAGPGGEQFTVENTPGQSVRSFELRRVVELYYGLPGHAVTLHKSLESGFQYLIERRDEEALRVAIITKAFRVIEIYITFETMRLRLITARLKN